jgi:hypothetical protein
VLICAYNNKNAVFVVFLWLILMWRKICNILVTGRFVLDNIIISLLKFAQRLHCSALLQCINKDYTPNIVLVRPDITPLNCRGGCYFVLIQSNQKSSQQKCFFAARALPTNQEKPQGCDLFAVLPYRLVNLHAKSRYAPSHFTSWFFLIFCRSCSADPKKSVLL